MMCKLDCPWLSLYLFVFFGSRRDPSILPRTGRKSSGAASGDLRFFPDNMGLVKCSDL